MKKIKILITIILLIFCFILNSELYQSHLTGFTAEYSYVNVTLQEENRENFFTYIHELSRSTKKPFFFINQTCDMLGETHLDIYCTENAYIELTEKRQLTQGVFKGALSGATSVSFHDLNTAAPIMEKIKLYIGGKNYELIEIYKKINQRFSTGYFHQDDNKGEFLFSAGLWALLGVFYLYISALDLQFRKKEIFLKISLGMPKRRVILENAIIDALVLSLTAVVMRAVFKLYFFTDFNLFAMILTLALIIILNFVIYLSLYRINYKKIIYGGNIGEATVSNCYLIKVASMVLTLTLLSVNVGLISVNIKPLINYKSVEKYEALCFVHLSQDKSTENDDLSPYYNKLLIDSIKTNSSTFSMNNPFTGGKRDFILTNDLSVLIKSGVKDYVNNGESIIILPYNCNNEEETEKFLLDTCSFYIKLVMGIKSEKIDFKILNASKPSRALYFDLDDSVNAKLGYAVADNPVFIYCNTENISFDSCDEELLSSSNGLEIMYETEFLNNSHSFLEENEINLEVISAESVFNNNKTVLTKIVSLSLILIILQLLIDFLLISALIKIEYNANAIELAVKKIVGYGIFSKNKSLIFLNVYSALIGIMTAIIIFFLLQISLKLVALGCGGIVLILETVITAWAISRFEKRNVIKIIKGGAL